MNIKEFLQKIKSLENDLILIIVIICVGLISFGLGRLSALSERKSPITIIQPNQPTQPTSYVGSGDASGEKLYVVSKNGAKYHYPWCSSAQNIKEENKIWFSTKEEAEAAGYSPASNCKGL